MHKGRFHWSNPLKMQVSCIIPFILYKLLLYSMNGKLFFLLIWKAVKCMKMHNNKFII